VLPNMLTNAAGLVTDDYSYEAFGNMLGSTGLTHNPFLFTGEQFDEETEFVYLRARYMNPAVGRFWSMDTHPGFDRIPLSLNKFLYAHGNPVMGMDPGGRNLVAIMLGVVAFGILTTASPSSYAGGIGRSTYPKYIVVNVEEYYVKLFSHGKEIFHSPIAVGASGIRYSVGWKHIVSWLEKPTSQMWTNTRHPWGDKENPDGQWGNPYGPWLARLDSGERHLHGTNGPMGELDDLTYLYDPDPSAPFNFEWTHGCIRLPNANIEKLHQLAPVGTGVKFITDRLQER